MRQRKYGNRKVELDGIWFDSQKEADRYAELKLMERGKIITNLQVQPSFEIQPAFEKNGIKYRAIKYIADFSYINEKGEPVVEDVKAKPQKNYYGKVIYSGETEVFKIKRKMFEYTHPNIQLTVVT